MRRVSGGDQRFRPKRVYVYEPQAVLVSLVFGGVLLGSLLRAALVALILVVGLPSWLRLRALVLVLGDDGVVFSSLTRGGGCR